jgi:hypothetical protein
MHGTIDTRAFAEWLSVDERFRRVIERRDQARAAEGAPVAPARAEPDGRPSQAPE